MADQDQIAILKQGIYPWNEWRSQHPEVRPDLTDADLRGLDVASYNEDYYSAMDEARYEMEQGEGIWEVDEEADIVVDARDLLQGFDLRNADLSNAQLNGACLIGAHFDGANLEDAVLDGSELARASFRGANLRRASLWGTNLRSADLNRANLTESVLFDADFSSAEFDETVVTGAAIGSTVFANNDMSSVVGLDSIRHSGPSTVGIDTLYKSQGAMPDTFLKGSGVPDTLITFIRSQPQQVLNFYTCFLSYAEADDAFSKKLLDDLVASGVRCWRWKEHAPLGTPIQKSITEAIQRYDKLILICSESSLKSPQVIREVERALQKEDYLSRKGKQADVLLPIRLDDFIFEWDHYRKADIILKPIGDFRDWSVTKNYRLSLERLMRDLCRR